MKLRDFKTEQWMNDYEGRAVYNMTDTCVKPFTWNELLNMDHEHLLNNVVMDYGTIKGDIRLKEEIIKLYRTGNADNVTLTQGCLEANELVMYSLLERGDNVLIFTPGYQQFTDIPLSIGCKVIEVPLIEDKAWMPDMQAFETAMLNRVKMIIINSPSNPTGTFFDHDLLDKIIEKARKYETWILSDEVYRGLNHDELSVSDIYEHGISTSSFSKLFSLAGLRLGWIKGCDEIIHLVNVRRDYSIISTGQLIDTLGLIALRNKEQILKRSSDIVNTNIDILKEWLEKEKRIQVVIPHAGTVCFLKYNLDIKSRELSLRLLNDKGIFFVPGECFGSEYHLRLGLTQESHIFREGLNVFSELLDIYAR